MNRLGLKNGPPSDTASIHREELPGIIIIPDSVVLFSRIAETGNPAEIFSFTPEQQSMISCAQSGRRFEQGVEHGVQIEGRTADHLKHVGGGSLSLQGLG